MTTKTAELLNRLTTLGFSFGEAQAIRRISMTLSRWAEAECNGEIERDENTEKPFRRYGNYLQANDPRSIHWIADREAGALKRLAKIMENHPSMVAYHQGDPRGAAIYIVSKEVLGERNLDSCYNCGIAVYK